MLRWDLSQLPQSSEHRRVLPLAATSRLYNLCVRRACEGISAQKNATWMSSSRPIHVFLTARIPHAERPVSRGWFATYMYLQYCSIITLLFL
jgi:hypothetical protein